MFNWFDSFFCSALLIFIGSAYFLRALLGITIPIFRIACSGLLIYGGLCALLGPLPSDENQRKTLLFEKSIIAHEGTKPYNMIFSRAALDLAHMNTPLEKQTITIDNVFGTVEVILNPQIPTRITARRAFALVSAPLQPGIVPKSPSLIPMPPIFGTYTYCSHPEIAEPLIEIDSRTIFGSITIRA